ncbi:YdeI/OmpD-associated family protein [Candidatus Korobacter versatilis]|nr:YdeI/OmpD-associated family protein [Candidatus Koribacter versatilis]
MFSKFRLRVELTMLENTCAMGTRDKRVDAYIEKSADFAQPILRYIRELVHEACPEVEETIKWSMPAFTYKGMYAGMASFKEHCALNFWKGSLFLPGPKEKDGMGGFGKLRSLNDLPPKKTLLGYLKEAKRLDDEGISVERPKPSKEKKDVVVPPFITAAIKKNKKAQATWDGFSNSHKKEYVEWITEAKTEETRNRRVQQMLEWLPEGKARNWKYERC